MIYIDSSVVLSRYLEEARTPAATFWQAPLVSSRLLEYEVINRLHAYECDASDIAEARVLLQRTLLIDLTRPVLDRALEPFPHRIRTLDGLHLATIDHLRRRGESIELASYDNRLCAAAEALRIPLAAL